MDSTRRPPRRTRATHSLEAILDAAIDMLDRGGLAGLTIRGLAAELGGGTGSVYWYVGGKDELVARATDAVLGRALADDDAMREGRLDPGEIRAEGAVEATDPLVAERLGQVRRTCLALFHQLELHSWAAPQLVGTSDVSDNSLRMWDRIGRELMDLPLSPREQFHSASTLLSFVTGVAAEMEAQGRQYEGDGRPREELMEIEFARWREAVPADTPFIAAMLDEFRRHDDHEQFVAGLDLVLAGIRTLAA